MRDAIPTRLMRRRGADYWRACKVLVNARNGRCGLENAVWKVGLVHATKVRNCHQIGSSPEVTQLIVTLYVSGAAVQHRSGCSLLRCESVASRT